MNEKIIDELVELLKSVDAFEGYISKILDINNDDDYTNIKWFHLCNGKTIIDAVNQYLRIKFFIQKYDDIDDLLLNALMQLYSNAEQLYYRLAFGDKTFLVIDEENFDFHSAENTGLFEICKDNDIHIVYTADNIRFYDFLDSKKYCLHKSSCYGQCDDAASWNEVYINEIK